MIFTALIFQSCVDSDQTKAREQNKSEEVVNEQKTEGENLGELNSGFGKSDAGNVMRFVINSGDYSTWGHLLSISSWSEVAAEKEVTFLCPNNEIFQSGKKHLIGELKRPENKALLDDLIGKHLLKGSMNIDAISKMETVETISGLTLKVDKALRTIGGIPYTSKEIMTEKGYVIVMEDLLEYPLEKLKESAVRNKNF